MYPIIFEFPEGLPLLGGVAITSFGVFMFLAFLVGGFALRAELARKGYDPEKAWDFVFMAVIGGILGAKLYYVLLNYPRLMQDPAGLIFSRGGMVFYGGFILAVILVIWSFFAYGLLVVVNAALNARSKAGVSMSISLGRITLVYVPLALAGAAWIGEIGVYSAAFVANLTGGAVALLAARRFGLLTPALRPAHPSRASP